MWYLVGAQKAFVESVHGHACYHARHHKELRPCLQGADILVEETDA